MNLFCFVWFNYSLNFENSCESSGMANLFNWLGQFWYLNLEKKVGHKFTCHFNEKLFAASNLLEFWYVCSTYLFYKLYVWKQSLQYNTYIYIVLPKQPSLEGFTQEKKCSHKISRFLFNNIIVPCRFTSSVKSFYTWAAANSNPLPPHIFYCLF